MHDGAAEGYSGLTQWAEPIIIDRLIQAYRQKIEGVGVARDLAVAHGRTWRALISGDLATFQSRRAELIESLAPHGLELDDFAAADSEILMELLEIVVARFQRSQRTAMGYHLALIELAGRLQPMRAA